MNPKQAAENRTARLAREAITPVYSTDTASAERKARESLRTRAQDMACGEDYCHVCCRATDHWGEHSDEQILAWARGPVGRMLLEKR